MHLIETRKRFNQYIYNSSSNYCRLRNEPMPLNYSNEICADSYPQAQQSILSEADVNSFVDEVRILHKITDKGNFVANDLRLHIS